MARSVLRLFQNPDRQRQVQARCTTHVRAHLLARTLRFLQPYPHPRHPLQTPRSEKRKEHPMQVVSNDGRIVRLSGRFGDCIFRTFKSGKIFVTFAPRDPRSIVGPLSVHFRKQIAQLNLKIVKNARRKQNPSR